MLFHGEYHSLLTGSHIACAIFLALLIKNRRSETAVTTKQDWNFRIIIQVFIQYRLQKVDHSGTGILSSITKLYFYQVSGFSTCFFSAVCNLFRAQRNTSGV